MPTRPRAAARRNAERHSVSDRMRFLECNMLDGFIDRAAANAGPSVLVAQHAAPQLATDASSTPRQSPVTSQQSPLFDLIASNPPYISRREPATLMREVRNHQTANALLDSQESYELYADLIT